MIENSMLEYLFGSKTRLKLLRLFFRDPLASFYVRELTRLLDIQINAVRRELELLIQSGLVKEIEQAHPVDSGKAGVNLRKYYALNTESILYPEMHALLIKAQVLGEQKFFDRRHMMDKFLFSLFEGEHVKVANRLRI